MSASAPNEKKIAVFQGGPTGEHPISLKTGKAAQLALARLGYKPLVVLVEQSGNWVVGEGSSVPPGEGLFRLTQENCAGAFLALHGPFGEDGTIQALLETIGLGYQGSAVRSSAVAMNKTITKSILKSHGLPVAPEVSVSRSTVREEAIAQIETELDYPLFIKPAHLGSSVGASKASNREELQQAISGGLAVDTSILVEPLLVGEELTCGVLVEEQTELVTALPSILIEPVGHTFFDFESKYTPGHNREICPAPISSELEEILRALALKSHRALGCRDISRTDFIVTAQGPIILEVNTLPGLTEASLIPKSASAAGLSFDDLIERLVNRAIARTTAKN